jgi:hypothetical protein
MSIEPSWALAPPELLKELSLIRARLVRQLRSDGPRTVWDRALTKFGANAFLGQPPMVVMIVGNLYRAMVGLELLGGLGRS